MESRGMGFSGGGLEGGVGGDCAAGTIVWVRRRNGSWWPGRILGPEEMSASHLMSPRSGTPVKLLGREDASVDWYNLEKSKRVKPFRCGEFDACIERAEASQGIPIKKREKYARREDAILHALELEKQQVETKQKKPGNIFIGILNKTTGAPRKDLNNFSSEVNPRNDDPGAFISHKYQSVSKETVVPYEEDNISKSLYIHKIKSGKKFVWEEDIPETIPPTSGLQDFGIRIAPLKSNLSHPVTWETSGKPVENHAAVLSCAGHMMEDSVHTGGGRSSIPIKRKRSEGGMVEDTFSIKGDRHQPLVQDLQSSAKLQISHPFQFDYDADVISREDEMNYNASVCRAKRSRCMYLPANSNDSLDQSGYHSEEMVITATQFGMDDHLRYPASFAEEYTSSGLIEATESDSSERVFWEDEMEENGNVLTDTPLAIAPGSQDCDPPDFQIQGKYGYMNKDEMPISSCISQAEASAEVGVYRWHMKGKRNARNFSRRRIDEMGGKISTNVAKGVAYGGKGSSFKMVKTESSSQRTSGRGLYHKKEFNRASAGGDLADTNLGGTLLTGYGSKKYPSPLQAAKDHGMSHISFNDSDSDSQSISQSGWEANGPYYCYEPMLVDVDLKVQARYQGEHVPLVSLMSRLNGKAIIGHPVQIEILEDGSSGQVLAFSRNDGGLDESRAPVAAWRTARRTAIQRVPRSRPATSAFGGEDTELLQYSYSGHFSHQAEMAKKNMSHARRPMPVKSHKKLPKRVSLPSNQKTRTLSSFATDHKRRQENVLVGLINPEGAVPLVACVPVKVVFSRILEAVGRPSPAAAHRVRMTSAAARDPL